MSKHLKEIKVSGVSVGGHMSATSGIHGVTGDVVGTIDTQTMTNKTLTSNTNNIRASELGTTGASVVVDTAAPPTTGNVLIASSATAAAWGSIESAGKTSTLITGNHTVTNEDIIFVNASAALTVSLPAINGVNQVHIVDVGGNAETNNITINPNGSETINNDTDVIINTNNSSITLMSDNSTNWVII
jgi:hypothetical protein